MKTISFKSPTRVDLAGGTLDMWPLYNFVNGACTINVAIDIYTTCEIRIREDKQVIINSPDLKKIWNFKSIQDFFSNPANDLNFYKTIFKSLQTDLQNLSAGFEIITASQSPIGGGLGGSSSLVISILKALHSLLNKPIPEVNKLVYMAHNIEAEMLNTPTGTQDYYPAVTGGLSFIEYNTTDIKQKVLPIDKTPLQDHFLLVYTGKSHHSGLNNFEVLKSAVQKDPAVLDALHKIKEIADALKESIEKNQWTKIPALFREEFAARVQLTPAFTSPEIERLNKICTSAGAEAVKICGAGGGGCVLVWVSPAKRNDVIKACQAEDFQCLDTKPVNPLN